MVFSLFPTTNGVIPAKAGIHLSLVTQVLRSRIDRTRDVLAMDPRLCGDDALNRYI